MYYSEDKGQVVLAEFLMPFAGKLDPQNRWVRLSSIMPWDKELSPEQQAACTAPNNVLLTACPGSGKTRTLTHRLAYQVLQKSDSRKINICKTSDVVLLFYTTSEVYTKFGMVSKKSLVTAMVTRLFLFSPIPHGIFDPHAGQRSGSSVLTAAVKREAAAEFSAAASLCYA